MSAKNKNSESNKNNSNSKSNSSKKSSERQKKKKSRSPHSVIVAAAQQQPIDMDDVIDLCDSDDDDRRLAPLRKRLKNQLRTKVKVEVKAERGARLPTILVLSDDEIEIVEKAKPKFVSAATATIAGPKTTDEDDDVEMVGFIGDKLPHMRCHCTDVPFQSTCMRTSPHATIQASLVKNKQSCALCYCYVCDKPVSECETWAPPTTGDKAYTSNAHCMAFDKGEGAHAWKIMRQNVKTRSSGSDEDSRDLNTVMRVSDSDPFYWLYHDNEDPLAGIGDRFDQAIGPFPPDHPGGIVGGKKLTKCRKCGWHSKLLAPMDVASCRHWCHKCGRVVSTPHLRLYESSKEINAKPESSSEKLNYRSYVKQKSDLLVGEKVIPFTIQAHDPRKITAFKKSWEEHEGAKEWTYDENEMQEDAFSQRFGKYVRPQNILECIPIVEKLPTNGYFSSSSISDSATASASLSRYSNNQGVSISETEGVILESRNHVSLLRELSNFKSFGKDHRFVEHYAEVTGQIEALWDKKSRKGRFTVRLYLRQNSPKTRAGSVTKLLGAWFDAFPYPIASLATGLTAEESTFKASGYYGDCVHLPPFNFTADEETAYINEMSDEIQERIDSFNAATTESRSKLSLLSSSGENFIGGIASPAPGDFASFLKGYFSEMLVDDLARIRENRLWSWLAKQFGAISAHRRMQNCSAYEHTRILGRHVDGSSEFESYLLPSDYPLAFENLRGDANSIRVQTKTLASLVQSLENLGHSEIPAVNGLTVDLLDFQKQSVQWALERERQDGGVQSFLWIELPSVDDVTVDKLYLNPVLDRVSKKKPKLVRGGLICEEMGLGKTIISLALILSNPAPIRPVAGSIVPDEFDEHDGEGLGWDPDLKKTIAAAAPADSKRGTILSRGTLVVCHVSLVGQWCEEAKSKLEDPGLIYPYHGSGRKRDPKLLAENSIVVTTYATLSSDKNYHAKNAGSSYCPPCEEVRWWRIICDESHTLRTASTKQSQAVALLVSDHTWCVTGTPVSTSLNDLSNQLKLVGIEHVAEYFEIFRCTVMRTINDPSKTKDRFRARMQREDTRLFGHFLFFMRNLMIRHTKTQKYVGTDSDLMALPAKTERTIEVTLTEEEQVEYDVLETEAKDFYIKFKERARKELSKYYLILSSALKAQRVAMSGGHAPITAYEDIANAKREESDSEDEQANAKKRKKVVTFSEFAYTSKLKMLITELTRIRDEEPGSKSLVFSNFSSTLKWLQEELPKHGFTFRQINGRMTQKKRAAALTAFQNDPPTTVFLLSMRSSNCGINLTSANRVFLLEPSMNPVAVQQTIGRVHRLGQRRQVEIIRMIVKDSIETRLTHMLDKKYNSTPSTAAENAVDIEARKSSPAESFVGSLSSDKTTVLTREFDWLFGVAPDKDEEDYEAANGENEGMPDAVFSSACGAGGESATSGEI